MTNGVNFARAAWQTFRLDEKKEVFLKNLSKLMKLS